MYNVLLFKSGACNVTNMTLLTGQNEVVYGLWNTTAKNNGMLLTSNTTASVYYFSSEGPEKALDQNTGTKYLIYTRNCSGNANQGYCAINTGFYTTSQQDPTLLLAIQFTTGSDALGRDPLSITIEGSNATSSALMLGTSWSLIYNGSTGLNTNISRRTDGPYQCIQQSPASYMSYRVLVTSIRSTDAQVQYSELKLFGYKTPSHGKTL